MEETSGGVTLWYRSAENFKTCKAEDEFYEITFFLVRASFSKKVMYKICLTSKFKGLGNAEIFPAL